MTSCSLNFSGAEICLSQGVPPIVIPGGDNDMNHSVLLINFSVIVHRFIQPLLKSRLVRSHVTIIHFEKNHDTCGKGCRVVRRNKDRSARNEQLDQEDR